MNFIFQNSWDSKLFNLWNDNQNKSVINKNNEGSIEDLHNQSQILVEERPIIKINGDTIGDLSEVFNKDFYLNKNSAQSTIGLNANKM